MQIEKKKTITLYSNNQQNQTQMNVAGIITKFLLEAQICLNFLFLTYYFEIILDLQKSY